MNNKIKDEIIEKLNNGSIIIGLKEEFNVEMTYRDIIRNSINQNRFDSLSNDEKVSVVLYYGLYEPYIYNEYIGNSEMVSKVTDLSIRRIHCIVNQITNKL